MKKQYIYKCAYYLGLILILGLLNITAAGKATAQIRMEANPNNLVANPGFEKGTLEPFVSNAVNGNIALETDPAHVYQGMYALRHEATGKDSYTNPWYGSNIVSNESQDRTYRLSVWVKANEANTPVRIFIFCLDANYGNDLPYRSAKVFTIGTDWQKITHTHICTADRAYVSIRLDNRGGSGRIVWWDDVSLVAIQNYLPNPGLETMGDALPFTDVINGDLEVDTGVAYKGTRSLKHKASSSDSFTLPWDGSNLISYYGEATFTFSAWAKAELSSVPVQLYIFCLDEDKNADPAYWSKADFTVGSSAWQKVSYTYTCPAGRRYASVRLDNDAGEGGSVWWDDLIFEQVGHVTFNEPTTVYLYAGETYDLGILDTLERGEPFALTLPAYASNLELLRTNGPVTVSLEPQTEEVKGMARTFSGSVEVNNAAADNYTPDGNGNYPYRVDLQFEYAGSPVLFSIVGLAQKSSASFHVEDSFGRPVDEFFGYDFLTLTEFDFDPIHPENPAYGQGFTHESPTDFYIVNDHPFDTLYLTFPYVAEWPLFDLEGARIRISYMDFAGFPIEIAPYERFLFAVFVDVNAEDTPHGYISSGIEIYYTYDLDDWPDMYEFEFRGYVSYGGCGFFCTGPQIEVADTGGNPIVNSYAFDPQSGQVQAIEFRISNIGDENLTDLVVDEAGDERFSVQSQPAPGTVTPGGAPATFTIRFDATNIDPNQEYVTSVTVHSNAQNNPALSFILTASRACKSSGSCGIPLAEITPIGTLPPAFTIGTGNNAYYAVEIALAKRLFDSSYENRICGAANPFFCNTVDASRQNFYHSDTLQSTNGIAIYTVPADVWNNFRGARVFYRVITSPDDIGSDPLYSTPDGNWQNAPYFDVLGESWYGLPLDDRATTGGIPVVIGDRLNPRALSSDYGPRFPTNPNASRFHPGIDIPFGTQDPQPVYAIAAGTVVTYGCSTTNRIDINHDGYKTGYIHLSTRLVSLGDQVVQGQLIGYTGSVGTTNHHLHFDSGVTNNCGTIYHHPMDRLPYVNDHHPNTDITFLRDLVTEDQDINVEKAAGNQHKILVLFGVTTAYDKDLSLVDVSVQSKKENQPYQAFEFDLNSVNRQVGSCGDESSGALYSMRNGNPVPRFCVRNPADNIYADTDLGYDFYIWPGETGQTLVNAVANDHFFFVWNTSTLYTNDFAGPYNIKVRIADVRSSGQAIKTITIGPQVVAGDVAADGTTIMQQFSVTNYDYLTGSITLEVRDLPPGWTYTISDSHPTLAGGETRNLTLTLTAPTPGATLGRDARLVAIFDRIPDLKDGFHLSFNVGVSQVLPGNQEQPIAENGAMDFGWLAQQGGPGGLASRVVRIRNESRELDLNVNIQPVQGSAITTGGVTNLTIPPNETGELTVFVGTDHLGNKEAIITLSHDILGSFSFTVTAKVVEPGTPPGEVPDFEATIDGQDVDGLVIGYTNPAVNFSWNHAQGLGGIEKYELVIQPTDGSGYLYHPYVLYPATSHTIQTNGLEYGKFYSVHIRARDRNGTWGPYTDDGFFIVQDAADPTPPFPPGPTTSPDCVYIQGNTCFVEDTDFVIQVTPATDNPGGSGVNTNGYWVCRSNDTPGWGGCEHTMTWDGTTSFTVTGADRPAPGQRRAYYFRARDNAGNWSEWNDELYIQTVDGSGDDVPPTPPGPTTSPDCLFVSGENNTCYVADADFTIQVTPATDNPGGSGIDTDGYSICRSEDTIGWGGCKHTMTWNGTTSFVVTGSDRPAPGQRRAYYFRARDNAGNWGDWNDELYVQTIHPSGDITPPGQPGPTTSPECVYTQGDTCFVEDANFVIQVTPAADNPGGSGVDTDDYRVCRSDNTPGWGGCDHTITWNGTTSFVVTGSDRPAPGQRRAYYFRARDNAGNWGDWNDEMYIQTIAPGGDITPPSPPGPTTSPDCVFTLGDTCYVEDADFVIQVTPAIDNPGGSGVDPDGYQVCRSNNTAGWGGCEVTITMDGTVSLVVTGSHRPAPGQRRAYYFRTRDNAGNRGDWNDELYIQTIAPGGDITPPSKPGPTTSPDCVYTQGNTCFVEDADFVIQVTPATDNPGGSGVNANGYNVCRSNNTMGWGGCDHTLTTNGTTLFVVTGSDRPAPGQRRAYYFRARDNAGNWGDWNDEMYIQTITPGGDITPPGQPGATSADCLYIQGNTCFVADANFTIQVTPATDNPGGSGVDVEGYQVCRSNPTTGWGGCEHTLTYNSTTSFVVTGSNRPAPGERRAYYFRARDNAGNWGAWNDELYIQTIAP